MLSGAPFHQFEFIEPATPWSDPDFSGNRSYTMRFMMIALSLAFSSPAMAESYERVKDRGVFVGLVSGKSLTSLGVSLTVSPSGKIAGSAFGREVTGSWTWNGGYFCRTMKAGDRTFARNCQVVQLKGNRLRFIADQGSGATADLRIR
jgi:hypothetical protein